MSQQHTTRRSLLPAAIALSAMLASGCAPTMELAKPSYPTGAVLVQSLPKIDWMTMQPVQIGRAKYLGAGVEAREACPTWATIEVPSNKIQHYRQCNGNVEAFQPDARPWPNSDSAEMELHQIALVSQNSPGNGLVTKNWKGFLLMAVHNHLQPDTDQCDHVRVYARDIDPATGHYKALSTFYEKTLCAAK